MWVRFDHWDDGVWRWVIAARHTPFRADEPRGSGFVHFDASDTEGGRFSFGGFSPHEKSCLIRQEVTS